MTLLRFLAVVGLLSVGLLAVLCGEATAQGPKPEPAPATFHSLRPDPAPSARPAQTVSSASSSTSQSSAPAQAPAAPPASTSYPTAPPTQSAVSSSTQPAPSSTSGSRASSSRSKGRKSGSRVHKTSQVLSHHTSGRLPRLLSVPAFLRAKLHLGAAEAVVKPSSRNTTLLLAGALALVVLVLGETTLLTFARTRIGVPTSRQTSRPVRQVPRKR